MKELIPAEVIVKKINLIHGHRVMLDSDLAEMYDLAAKVLLQVVKRNLKRFPPDFMFQLNNQEVTSLKSQILISSWGGSRRAKPYAFTEQGVQCFQVCSIAREQLRLTFTPLEIIICVLYIYNSKQQG
jgi:hypothetical protein